MTNRIAAALALLLLAGLAADAFLNGFAASLFLARRLFALLDYIAFWR